MHFDNYAHYLWQACLSTFSQLVILLGPGLALAFAMHLLAGFIAERACRLIGRNAFLLIFGWLGTIIHEGGHALFCLLFGHRITAIKWFDWSGSDGTLGYVRHSYDRNSLYQRSGNFFIGIGPILLGSVVLYYASRYLLGPELFASLKHNTDAALLASQHSFAALAKSVSHSCVTIFSAIFTAQNLTSWRFYVFLYLTFSVGSSITLSPARYQRGIKWLCRPGRAAAGFQCGYQLAGDRSGYCFQGAQQLMQRFLSGHGARHPYERNGCGCFVALWSHKTGKQELIPSRLTLRAAAGKAASL